MSHFSGEETRKTLGKGSDMSAFQVEEKQKWGGWGSELQQTN